MHLVQHRSHLAPRRRQPPQLAIELGPLPVDPLEIREDPADIGGVERADRGGTTQLVELRRRQHRGSRHGRECIERVYALGKGKGKDKAGQGPGHEPTERGRCIRVRRTERSSVAAEGGRRDRWQSTDSSRHIGPVRGSGPRRPPSGRMMIVSASRDRPPPVSSGSLSADFGRGELSVCCARR